jgi:hypothetical protein
MRIPEESIKREWIISGTNELWGTRGTYSRVAYERLPSPPPLDANFGWLSELPSRDYGCTLDSDDNRIAEFLRLDSDLQSLGFAFPDEFRVFISRTDIQAQIPSCTACYLELSQAVTQLPGYPSSYVVRFMNDSQACELWYLLFQPSVPTRVRANSCFIERDIFDAMQYEKDIDEPLSYDAVLDESCVCSESFGEFIFRFCVENTIWFATHDKLPLAPYERDYLRAAIKEA